MRQERRQENRALRKEQRLERQGKLPVEDSMAPTEETAPEMTGAMAGGVDLRPNKVGLDTGGGAAKNGGFKDRRKVRKARKTVRKNMKKVTKMQKQAQRKNRRMQRN